MYRNLAILLLALLGLSSCASCSDMISHSALEKTPAPVDNSAAMDSTQSQVTKPGNTPNP